MTARPLVIFGAGALARLMHFYFTRDGNYQIAAFCVDRDYTEAAGDEQCGLPVLAYDDAVVRFPPATHQMFVAIGYKRMRDRQRLFDKVRDSGYTCASYVSPRAMVSDDVSLGENNVVMDGVLIEPFVTIGDNNLFWCGTQVSHECRIGNHNYLSAKVVVGGQSVIDDGCFLGNGACTINAIHLPDETMLLPGAYAFRDAAKFTKYMGNPARAAGTHEEHGIVILRG